MRAAGIKPPEEKMGKAAPVPPQGGRYYEVEDVIYWTNRPLDDLSGKLMKFAHGQWMTGQADRLKVETYGIEISREEALDQAKVRR